MSPFLISQFNNPLYSLIIKYRPSSHSELPQIILNMELIHLGLEASNYFMQFKNTVHNKIGSSAGLDRNLSG